MGELVKVGQMVHYVARGSADGMYPAVCRAATVTEVMEGSPAIGLAVVNPTGLFFRPLTEGGCLPDFKGFVGAGAVCPETGLNHQGGTWHIVDGI